MRVPIDFHRTSTRPTSQSHPILLNQSISFPPSGSYRLPLSPRIPTLRTQLTETQCQCISQSTPLPCTVNQRHVEETFTRCQVQRSWRQRRGGEGSEGGRGGNDVRACGRVRGNQSKCGGVTTSLWSDFASYPSFLPPCFLPFLPSIQHSSSSIVIVVDRRRRGPPSSLLSSSSSPSLLLLVVVISSIRPSVSSSVRLSILGCFVHALACSLACPVF